MVMVNGSGTYQCGHLADLLYTEGAETLARYGSDFYQGMPALTKNQFGNGAAYYIASDPEMSFLEMFYGRLIAEYNLGTAWNAPAGVEITQRFKDGRAIIFILNHNSENASLELGSKQYLEMLSAETVTGTLQLGVYGVCILREKELSA